MRIRAARAGGRLVPRIASVMAAIGVCQIPRVVRLDNISKRHGPQILFVDASAAIQRGEKIGLVGRRREGCLPVTARRNAELPLPRGRLRVDDDLLGTTGEGAFGAGIPHSNDLGTV